MQEGSDRLLGQDYKRDFGFIDYVSPAVLVQALDVLNDRERRIFEARRLAEDPITLGLRCPLKQRYCPSGYAPVRLSTMACVENVGYRFVSLRQLILRSSSPAAPRRQHRQALGRKGEGKP
jgi:hypothetical protein